MSGRIPVREVIVVEGRYDKNTLLQIFDAAVVETGGFGINNDAEKLALLRRLAAERGLVVLTDSDAAGFMIRAKLKGAIDPALVKHAYIPDVPGRERRKRRASKEGKLGVEGMEREVLIDALRRAWSTEGADADVCTLSVPDALPVAVGLSGAEGSAERRRELLRHLALPERMSANAMLDVLNALYTREELERICAGLMSGGPR